jgi:hypothetical protein
MDEPLHPSSLSEILDRTAQIYRARFLVFLGIAVIPTGVLLVSGGAAVLLFQWWGSSGGPRYPAAGFLAVAFLAALPLVVLPALLVVTALAQAAMSHAAARAFLGQAITIRDSYKVVWRRGWRYIGLFIIEIVAVWVVPFAAWFVIVLLSAGLAALAQNAGLGTGGLFVLAAFLVVVGLVTYGFWRALRLSLAFPACVVEQLGAWDGIKRSSLLTKGTRGRILLLYLLGAALNWILSIAITLPLTIAMALAPGSSSPQHAQRAAMVMVFLVYGAAFAVQALTRPVYGIALILFYYDQRIRQEGFDIEWMMLQAGLVVPPPQTQAEAQPWLPVISVTENPPAPESVPIDAQPISFAEAPAQPTGEPPSLR